MGPQPQSQFAVRLPASLESSRLARNLLHQMLAPVRASEQLRWEAELVLHELVTNGVVHGSPDRDGTIGVSCSCNAAHLYLTVHDCGSHGVVAPRRLTPDTDSGRGLSIVDALTAAWTVDRSDGTRVSARFDL